MKKLLSVVLALAIVIGCLSMATFAGDGQWPASTDVTAIRLVSDLTHSNKTMISKFTGITTNDIIEETVGDNTERYLLLQYKIYNLNSVSINVSAYSYVNSGGWQVLQQTYPGNENDSNEQTIPANSARIYTIKIPVTADNKFTKNDGVTTYAIGNGASLNVRIDQKNNHSNDRQFVVEALNEVSALFCENAADTQYIFTVTKMYGANPVDVKGVKLTVTQNTDANAGMIVFGTAAGKQDGAVFEDCPDFTGALTVSYTFYNPNDTEVSVGLRFTRRAHWGYNAGNNLKGSEVTIPANSKAVLTNSINVTNGKLTLDGQEINASDIRIRFNIDYQKLEMGAVYYIETTNANDPMFYGTTSNNGFSKGLAEEFPNLQMMETPVEPPVVPPATSPETSPETPPEEPQVPVGQKWTIKEDGTKTTLSINDYNRSPWAADDTFTGQKQLSYTVYNTSDKTVTVDLQIMILLGGSTHNGDAETMSKKVTIPAGYKGEISALVNVENGTAKLKADGSKDGALNLIRLRFNLTYASNYKKGDTIIIVPNDGNMNDFALTSFSASEIDREDVYELPNYETATDPVGQQWIIKEDSDKKSLSINDYGNSPWGNDDSFTGQKKLDYIVYNTSKKTVTVELYLTVLLDLTDNGENDPTTYSGDPETYAKITLPAGGKGELSALVNVVNGVAKLKADGSRDGNLNLIRVRFTLTYADNVKKGDSIIIAPADGDMEDFAMSKFAASGVNKETVYKFPAESEKPVGVVLTVPEDKEIPFFITAEGVFDADPTFTGTKEITYTVYNKTSMMLVVTPALQVKTVDSKWSGPSGDKVIIPIGQKAEVKASIEVVNGKVTITSNEYDLNKVFLRFNFTDAKLKKGDKIYIAANEDLDIIYNPDPISTSGMSLDVVYELPAVEAPKIPQAIKVTAAKEMAASNAYISTSTGIVTANDIKDGEIIKKFKVKNNSNADIMVKLDLVATVKVDGESAWRGVEGADSEFVTIAPGKTAEIQYVCDTKDGKVELTTEEEVAVSELLAKISIKNEEGTIKEGTTFTIYFDEANMAKFVELKSGSKWSYEILYSASGAGTGDVLPVALIASVMFGFVLLTLVSKKRKEN